MIQTAIAALALITLPISVKYLSVSLRILLDDIGTKAGNWTMLVTVSVFALIVTVSVFNVIIQVLSLVHISYGREASQIRSLTTQALALLVAFYWNKIRERK